MSPRLMRLSQEKWELALRVVYQAWETADGQTTSFRPPKGLKHLQQQDWEKVCQCLIVLQHQRECSPLH